MGRLSGRVAVITGGASGIGAATVERFVAEGAAVVFCDLDEAGGKELADRAPDATRFVPADVSDRDSLARVFAEAVDVFGGLDVVWQRFAPGHRAAGAAAASALSRARASLLTQVTVRGNRSVG